MLEVIFHQPWRSGWLGKLLRRHSPAEEDLGLCWCQKPSKDRPELIVELEKLFQVPEPVVDSGGDVTQVLITIPFIDDRDTYIPKDQ